jgi:signal transduction histidine kinase
MHERVDAIGAQLQIDSQPGHGTEVMVRWPTR